MKGNSAEITYAILDHNIITLKKLISTYWHISSINITLLLLVLIKDALDRMVEKIVMQK